MTTRDFAYWLQGFIELAEPTTLNEKQTELVKRHLNMVFIHDIDPSFKEDLPELQKAHSGVESLTLDKYFSSKLGDMASDIVNC